MLGTQSVAAGQPKGAGASLALLVADVLARVYRPGEPCIFDLVEEAVPLVLGQDDDGVDGGVAHDDDDGGNDQQQDGAVAVDLADLGPEPPWILSDVLTEKKSVFIARAAVVASPAQAKLFLRHLLASDKKVARATHNITAWRIKAASASASSSSAPGGGGKHSQHQSEASAKDARAEAVYQDCDSDGETAAGGRLLHLLQLMDVWDVMVVVTRWYGGVLLGPDRFRFINQVARDAVVKGGWVKEDAGGKKKKK